MKSFYFYLPALFVALASARCDDACNHGGAKQGGGCIVDCRQAVRFLVPWLLMMPVELCVPRRRSADAQSPQAEQQDARYLRRRSGKKLQCSRALAR
jgi:hypothetical protein